MFQNFRQSMTWLHTWFGLVLGYVLIVAFFFGSLSVFDREIDRWAIPETRFAPQVMPSFDERLKPIFAQMKPDEHELALARDRVGGPLPDAMPVMNWSAYTTHRDPVLAMYAEFAVTNNPEDPHDHVHGYITIDPRTGKQLPHDQLKIGSEFFYPMHYSLHLEWKNLGIWIVGFAAMVMLVALVSGIVMHRKILREMFTFRPGKATQRSTLDLHNLTGVVALPFHFIFALSGLTIFASIYLPVGETMLERQQLDFFAAEERARGLEPEPSGVAASLASVDAMVVEAKRRWAARGMPGEVGYLYVNHVGDASSYVSVYRAGSDRVALVGQAIHFSGVTGRVVHEEPAPPAAYSVNEFLTGLHLQHFEHWLLRWFYVLGGLAGCVCIATGFVFFVEKRKRSHAKAGTRGARWVDAFAVTAVTGMLIATASILLMNRLLPAEFAGRATWEESAFWISWLAALLHALARGAPVERARISPAWREQACVFATLAFGAAIANGAGTGDWLWQTIAARNWPVAGLDLALLVAGSIALVVARLLRRRELDSDRDAVAAADGLEVPKAGNA
jgi:uncharacterized iron-regulated membrane protein